MTSEATSMAVALRQETSAVILTNQQLQMIAHTPFVPAAFRGKVPEILACVATGRALGLPDMTSLRGIHVIDGKATFSAELMDAIVRAHGHSISGTVDDEKAVVRGRRADNGDEMEATFTLAMAERAGLLGRPSWKKHPDDMMWARAVSKLCRRLFADCFAGATYVPEEVEATADEVMDEPVEVREEPPASRPAESPKAADGPDPVAPTPPGDTTPEAEDHPPLSSASGFKVPRKVAEQAGETVIPSGKYGRQTIAQVAESLDGAEWFMAMLKANDSPTRDAVVTYAREFLPDVWAAYEQSKMATA